MIKLFLYLFTLILLVNCSVDTRSGIWENVNETKSAKKISKPSFWWFGEFVGKNSNLGLKCSPWKYQLDFRKNLDFSVLDKKLGLD